MAYNMSALSGSLPVSAIHQPKPMRQSRPRQSRGPALPSWAISRFELGYTDKDGAFSVEFTYDTNQNGRVLVDHENRRVLIKDGPIEIHISDFSIEQAQVLTASPTELLFSLAHAPFFGFRNNHAQLSRAHSINQLHRHLGQAINQQVLLTFRDGAERDRFCEGDRRRGFPKPVHANVAVVVRGLWSAEKMRQVEELCKGMKGPVAFQVSSPDCLRSPSYPTLTRRTPPKLG